MHFTAGKRAEVKGAEPKDVHVIYPKEERGGHYLWVVILILAVIALALTIIFGYDALAPWGTLHR